MFILSYILSYFIYLILFKFILFIIYFIFLHFVHIEIQYIYIYLFMNLLRYPNKILFNKSSNLIHIDLIIYIIIIKAMVIIRKEKALGLALSQLGKLNNTFISNKKIFNFNVFINSKIIWFSKKYISSFEGCLSLLYLYRLIKRRKYIVIIYININYKKILLYIKNNNSIFIQHEYDHIYGNLITNRKV